MEINMEELGFNMDDFMEIPTEEIKENDETNPNEDSDNTNENQDQTSEEQSPEEVASEGGGEPTKDKDSADSSSPGNLYSSLAKFLNEEGLLPTYDPEKSKFESKDDFVEAIKESIKTSEFADLTESQKKYLQAVRSGIQPEQAYESVAALENLNTITKADIETNDVLRKELIFNDFIQKGYSKEKAEKLTQRSIDIGEDLDDSLEALESIKATVQKEYEANLKAANEAKLKAKQENDAQLEKLKETITKMDNFIPNYKVSEKDKQKIYEQAVKPIQLEDGRVVNAVVKARLDNPVEFEAKLNYLFYITKGFKDFNIIKNKVTTSAVKELEDKIRGNTFIPSGSASTEHLDFDPYNSALTPDIIDNII